MISETAVATAAKTALIVGPPLALVGTGLWAIVDAGVGYSLPALIAAIGGLVTAVGGIFLGFLKLLIQAKVLDWGAVRDDVQDVRNRHDQMRSDMTAQGERISRAESEIRELWRRLPDPPNPTPPPSRPRSPRS